MYFVTEPSKSIRPSSTSAMIPAEVNCLPTDPLWNIDLIVTGVFVSMFATPNPFARTTSPSLITAKATPGIFSLFIVSRTRYSIFETTAAGSLARCIDQGIGRGFCLGQSSSSVSPLYSTPFFMTYAIA